MLVWGSRSLRTPLMGITLVRPLLVLPSRDLTESVDKKCPFAGDVSIRGRILTGRVVSTKMTRTIIIRRDYLHFIPKYRACPVSEIRPIIILRWTFDQVDSRNDTRTWLLTFHRRSVWTWEMLLQLVRIIFSHSFIR